MKRKMHITTAAFAAATLLAALASGLNSHDDSRWLSHLRSTSRITEVNPEFGGESRLRSKRAAPADDVTPVSDLATAFHLNNSHLHLMVHWVGQGSPIMFCLARDQVMEPGATSQVLQHGCELIK